MQSEPSQMTAETKAVVRSSPVTDTTGNSMARSPTQEPASPSARVQPSTNAWQQRNHPDLQKRNSRGRGMASHPFPRLIGRIKEEHITHGTSGETREAEVQDDTSPQQMNHNTRSTLSGRRSDPSHHNRHGQTHDEHSDADVREDVDDGGANEGEGEEVVGEVKEAEGNELPTNRGLRSLNPMRVFHGRRESTRDFINRLERVLRKKEHDVDVLSTRNEQLSDEIKILKEELARLQFERDQTRQLLHERTAELSSARVFLGKADTVSVTDVSRMVDILNAEISQASISIADSLSYVQGAPADTTELNRLLHQGRSSIGDCLCDILASRLCRPGAEFDPMITQLALQAGLSKACYLIINDWNPPFWDSFSTVNRIYANMRLSEGQVIVGRWRALARTYINSQDSENGIRVQDAKNKIREANANYLRSVLRDLLAIVGWSSRGPHQNLPSEYNEKMRILSDEALKLHETIGRGITSRDLVVEVIPCETRFDPTKMDDADRQRGKPDDIPDDIVACTVELGLRYKSAKPGGDSEESGVVLKPKVLLASLFAGEHKEVTAPKAQN